MKCMGKVNVKECQAECCGFVPIEKAIVDKYKDRMRKGSVMISELNGTQVWVKNGKCAFLGKNFKCLIYENRPEVCRLMGSGERDHPLLKCHHLGQTINSQIEKYVDNTTKKW